jgi:hypothetical protein
MPPIIDDLGLGELPVDSAQDQALAGLLCAGNGARLKPGGIWSMLVDGGMVLVMGQDAGVLPAIVRGSSGTALGIV